ncbi:MAG: 30S ribosomal protein S5 [Leptospiraceae bacterium]|nr:30S ribosomal protein S5 [Leptospiraceae bacterium]MDW7975188.1 30S ribosomal protein S5 [Leptospiraceae bacterium]
MLIKDQREELYERAIKVNRVTKVVRGGRRFSFNALVVVGNKKGKVGIGFGKAKEVPEAIRKAMERAKKNLIEVAITKRHTIPHDIIGEFKATKVWLKPASPGTGVIAGESVKAVLEMAGYQDVLTKVIGSKNYLNVVKATMKALQQLETPIETAKKRGISLKQLFGELD